jgi:3,4-dihydroxy 2-butanone 4-phosphate synthase/GTP cyclohydrolase II
MARIAREGRGVVLYLQQDAVGTSLLRLFDAHVLRVANDPRAGEPENKRPGARKPILRELGIGAQILRALGVRRMRLLSSHDRLLVALEGYGLEVAELLRFDDEAPPAHGDVVSIQDPKGRGVR